MSKAIKPKAPRQPKTLKKSTGMYMPKIKPIKLVMGYMKKNGNFVSPYLKGGIKF
jgi:hypothetical protein